MLRVVADNDVQGHLTELVRLLISGAWRELFSDLQVTVETFETLDLSRKANDREVWQKCQGAGVILFTGNRSGEGATSLEMTIRQNNQLDSLPVITLGNPRRFTEDRAYAQRAADRLIGYLLELDAHRGAGRLYVP